MAHSTPLYVREHTKKHLETALHNDSLFLANNKVMDYSLIVGIDKNSRELVVGIVDFLRPYTWDKRLETWVKETAYIGGGTREPTVLNPRVYKNRFREAMSRCKCSLTAHQCLFADSAFQISYLSQTGGHHWSR